MDFDPRDYDSRDEERFNTRDGNNTGHDGFDRDPDARADVPAMAEAKPGRQARGGIIGVPGAVQRAEKIRLQEAVEQPAAAIAQRHVHAVFDAGFVERSLHVMNVEAAEQLESDGVAVRVVSMPCMDTFAEQDESYREEVLPSSCRARVAVEAACPLGWDRWIGPEGEFLGMRTFGESGPAKDVYEHFGITSERLVELGRSVMDRVGARSG